ncbi:MAG: hypothetical protein ACREJM_13095 [Candidatus Saccharimonadales bacterium]
MTVLSVIYQGVVFLSIERLNRQQALVRHFHNTVWPESMHSFSVCVRSLSRRFSGIILMAMKRFSFDDAIIAGHEDRDYRREIPAFTLRGELAF